MSYSVRQRVLKSFGNVPSRGQVMNSMGNFDQAIKNFNDVAQDLKQVSETIRWSKPCNPRCCYTSTGTRARSNITRACDIVSVISPNSGNIPLDSMPRIPALQTEYMETSALPSR